MKDEYAARKSRSRSVDGSEYEFGELSDAVAHLHGQQPSEGSRDYPSAGATSVPLRMAVAIDARKFLLGALFSTQHSRFDVLNLHP